MAGSLFMDRAAPKGWNILRRLQNQCFFFAAYGLHTDAFTGDKYLLKLNKQASFMQDIAEEIAREFLQSPEGEQMIERIAKKIIEDHCNLS